MMNKDELEGNANVVKGNGQLQVHLSVIGKMRDLSTLRALYYRLLLYDDQGKQMSWQSASSHSSASKAGASMTFALPGKGAKAGTPTRLVFLHWETKPYLIPFEFRDVPLP